MASIGIRELKNQATEILRTVREEHTEYIVTYRGEPVAFLLPLDNVTKQPLNAQPLTRPKPSAALLAELEKLRQKIGQDWKTKSTAAEAVAEQRRVL